VERIGLSVAHGGSLTVVAVAIGDVRLGIDLEPLDRDVAGWALEGHALTGRERAALAELDGGLVRAWVRKEALLKAAGAGLGIDPASLELDREGRVVSLPESPALAGDWALADVPLDGYAVALAADVPLGEITITGHVQAAAG
jgi:4'-phosphopantetheinyl transferase